jgi:hypothetical protein
MQWLTKVLVPFAVLVVIIATFEPIIAAPPLACNPGPAPGGLGCPNFSYQSLTRAIFGVGGESYNGQYYFFMVIPR